MKKKWQVLWVAVLILSSLPTISTKIHAAGEVVLGDILLRHEASTEAFDSTNVEAFKVKPGEKLEFTSSLYTGQIKQQIIRSGLRTNNLVSHIASSFEVTINFPTGLDISEVDTQAIKNEYGNGYDDPRVLRFDPASGEYSQSYVAPETERKVTIDNNYHNDNVGAFYISDVSVSGQQIKVTLTLNTSSYYTAPNDTLGTDTTYGGYLLAAVAATPDYLALTIPGVKVASDFSSTTWATVSADVKGKFYADRQSFFGLLKYQFTWDSQQDTNIQSPTGNYSGLDVALQGSTDTTIQASLQPHVHTVDFDTDGGSLIDAQKIWDGEKATSKVPTKEGFSFKGWQLNGTDYDFSAEVHQDLTLRAIWESSAPAPTPSPAPKTQRKVPNTATK